MPKPKKNNPMMMLLADVSAPLEQRLEVIKMLVCDPRPEAREAVAALLERLAHVEAEAVYAERLRQLSEMVKQLEEGPLRPANYVGKHASDGSSPPRGEVILDDGTTAFAAVPNEDLAGNLRRGDRVLLDGKGRALLHQAPGRTNVGEEAQLERRIGDDHVEISLRGQERHVFLASQDLLDKLNAGEVGPGATVLVNSRQFFAFDAVPSQDGLAHYKYLVREPVPDVFVDRDIGAPPRCIQDVAEFIHTEMTHPEVRRSYSLSRSVMKLLCGVSGSGKTLAVLAMWRQMYEEMSQMTGVPVDQLPPRVFRLNLSRILSMWLGESDKNLDRFFSEVEQLAEEPFIAPDGREYKLPVLAILEEIDGLARTRGQEPIFDRILTTALQRLDSTREELKNKLIIFLGTTNDAQHVDRAFLRRIGGTIEHFGRLNKKSFVAILQKHLRRLPVVANNGCTPQEIQRRFVVDLTAWLFSPNGSDRGLVELTYAGSTTPAVRCRRDFLTGALIDRAVQQAATAASHAEAQGAPRPGVSFELLVQAFDQQVRGVADQLTEHNVAHYLDVPDGARVANLRRIPQPSLLPHELQRT